MDLAEAEAVADIIASSSRSAHKVAMSQMRGGLSKRLSQLHDSLLDLASLLELELDFSEEEVEFASRERLITLAHDVDTVVSRLVSSFATGQAIKDGVPVTIAGETNVGKSTLLNALLHEQRAIVSDIHGTTRDAIEDTVEIGGVLFRITDTAGLRITTDPIESMGIELAHSKMRSANVLLWVVDPMTDDKSLQTRWADISGTILSSAVDSRLIVVVNKLDVTNDDRISEISMKLRQLIPTDVKIIAISAKNGDGISQLESAMVEASGATALNEDAVMVTNARHYAALVAAKASNARALAALSESIPADLIAQDIRETIYHLSTITGAITSDDILATIFSRFCIGK
jgi:tRNA modification GTPase